MSIEMTGTCGPALQMDAEALAKRSKLRYPWTPCVLKLLAQSSAFAASRAESQKTSCAPAIFACFLMLLDTSTTNGTDSPSEMYPIFRPLPLPGVAPRNFTELDGGAAKIVAYAVTANAPAATIARMTKSFARPRIPPSLVGIRTGNGCGPRLSYSREASQAGTGAAVSCGTPAAA